MLLLWSSALDSYSERGLRSRSNLLLGPTILRQLLLLLPLVSSLCPPPILQGGRGFLFRRRVIRELPAAHRPIIQPALPWAVRLVLESGLICSDVQAIFNRKLRYTYLYHQCKIRQQLGNESHHENTNQLKCKVRMLKHEKHRLIFLILKVNILW